MPQEYEKIVEFSFHPKYNKFVIRFLDGKSYTLEIKDLPKKIQTKKPDWESAYLSGSRDTIIATTANGKELREIPAFMIHANGS